MAQLRTPLLKPYLNSCAATINPFLMNTSCSRDEPSQQAITITNNQLTPTIHKFRDYKHLIHESNYNQSIRFHVNQGNISLIDIPNSKNDFGLENGVIHVLQLNLQHETRAQIEEVTTVATIYLDQLETTSINSQFSIESQMEGQYMQLSRTASHFGK